MSRMQHHGALNCCIAGLERVIRWTTGREKRHTLLLVRMLAPVMAASAFLNNTRESHIGTRTSPRGLMLMCACLPPPLPSRCRSLSVPSAVALQGAPASSLLLLIPSVFKITAQQAPDSRGQKAYPWLLAAPLTRYGRPFGGPGNSCPDCEKQGGSLSQLVMPVSLHDENVAQTGQVWEQTRPKLPVTCSLRPLPVHGC
eukprot:366227-Chlamydomonas_euryale.AAC.21